MADNDVPLEALQWHWGEAYIIAAPEPGVWMAERRDTHTVMRADSPEGLRDLIVADYFLRKVPRGGA